MSVQEKGYLLAGELMPSNLRIRMLYTVMFLSKLLSILVKDCMYRRRNVCNGERFYVQEKECILNTGEGLYVQEKDFMYRRMYVCT